MRTEHTPRIPKQLMTNESNPPVTPLSPFRLFIRLSRPFFLLGGIGQYLLGAGIARYLGSTIDWGIFLIGLMWGIAMQLATHYLNEYFDAPMDALNPNRTFFSGGSGVLGEEEGQLPRNVALVAAFGMLTIATFFTIQLVRAGEMSASLGIVMGLIFLGAVFYSVPPVTLSKSGYGELTTAILVGTLAPIMAFLLQVGTMHRLVTFTTLPLTFLLVPVLLAVEFPDYATDLKFGKRNLLLRAGWENAMTIHNTFILFAFVILGTASFLGLPSAIALPAFLAFPSGVLQIWQMRRIAAGAKPNWNALALNAVVTFGMMAYMLVFVYWTR